jgi:hypothetical protein
MGMLLPTLCTINFLFRSSSTFYLQDYLGLDLGRNGIQENTWGSNNNVYACWSILPISDENYFGVKPYSADVKDSEGNYWTTLCCDFDCIIPSGGGVLGAYTIKTETTTNGINYANPNYYIVKVRPFLAGHLYYLN